MDDIAIINVKGMDYKVSDTKARKDIEALKSIERYKIVDALPTQDISTSIIYLVKESSSSTTYKRWIYIDEQWVPIGTTDIDISSVILKTDINVNESEKTLKIL